MIVISHFSHDGKEQTDEASSIRNEAVEHLSENHRRFLLHWSRLQLLEQASSSNRLDGTVARIVTTDQGNVK